jgi:glutathione S-transferase
MEIRLLGSRLSPFVEKVYRAMRYKELDFEVVAPSSMGDLKKWNEQTGKMPVVELDGERIWDSTFILRELDERFSDHPLVSRQARTRALQETLEDWSDESLYWVGMAIRWGEKNADAAARKMLSGAPRVAQFVAVPAIKRKLGSTIEAQGLGRLPHRLLLEELDQHLERVTVLLGDDPFLFADRPSVADFAVYGQLRSLRSEITPGARSLVEGNEALVDYLERVEELSS